MLVVWLQSRTYGRRVEEDGLEHSIEQRRMRQVWADSGEGVQQ